MITREEVQAKFREYHYPQGPHDDVYTDGSKNNDRLGAAAVINRHFQNGETTCRQLSKRLPDNSTISAAEATAITLALDYYGHMNPVKHDVVFYLDSMSCLQAIEDKDMQNPLISHIMNLLWVLSDKGTCVRFCWVPSHCGIEGNEIVDQLAKETLYHDIDMMESVYSADLKRLVNSYIKQGVQTKWDVSIPYLTLLLCWVFWHHCATAMLGAQPPLSVGLCPIGTSTSELEWALAMRAMCSRLFVAARLWDMYPGIWGSSGTVCRYLSSMQLKSSTEQRVTFLTSMGSELNSLCPRTGRLA